MVDRGFPEFAEAEENPNYKEYSSRSKNPFEMYSDEWFIRQHENEIRDYILENRELQAKIDANNNAISKLREWNREILGRHHKAYIPEPTVGELKERVKELERKTEILDLVTKIIMGSIKVSKFDEEFAKDMEESMKEVNINGIHKEA